MTPTRVLAVQYANPAGYPPVAHALRILAEAGCEVTLVGTRGSDETLAWPATPRVTPDLLPAAPAGWRQKAHYARFAARVLRSAQRWRPHWIYAFDPLAAPAALAAVWRTGARCVYHEHDAPAPAGGSAAMRGVLRARAALARRATLCLVPGVERGRRLIEDTGAARVEVVRNCPRLADVAAARPHARTGGLRVLYHGSVVPARLPMTAIDAVATVDGASLGIAGYEAAGHPGYVAALVEHARARGVAHRVTWAGTLPARADVLAHADGFDVGLALMPTDTADFNEQTMVGASNKPFDYLARGLALVVSDRPEWRAEYVDAGMARSCRPDSAADIADVLRWFAARPDETRTMGERGRQRILSEWNFERGFARVLDVMTGEPAAAVAPRFAPRAPAEADAGRR